MAEKVRYLYLSQPGQVIPVADLLRAPGQRLAEGTDEASRPLRLPLLGVLPIGARSLMAAPRRRHLPQLPPLVSRPVVPAGACQQAPVPVRTATASTPGGSVPGVSVPSWCSPWLGTVRSGGRHDLRQRGGLHRLHPLSVTSRIRRERPPRLSHRIAAWEAVIDNDWGRCPDLPLWRRQAAPHLDYREY